MRRARCQMERVAVDYVVGGSAESGLMWRRSYDGCGPFNPTALLEFL